MKNSNLKTTVFRSEQNGITEENLLKYFTYIDYAASVNLYDINLSPSGHGHYSITAIFEVTDIDNNSHTVKVNRKTNNMQLIDAWKSNTNGLYENGDDGFDNWNEVVESMLFTINPNDIIVEEINK